MRFCRSSHDRSCWTICLKGALCLIAGVAVLSLAVMWLWNGLMPSLFSGVQTISYCEALGLLLLSRLLFGHFPCGHRHGMHRHPHGLTPEEREAMKTHLRQRWGHWCGCAKKPGEPNESDEPGSSAPSAKPGA